MGPLSPAALGLRRDTRRVETRAPPGRERERCREQELGNGTASAAMSRLVFNAAEEPEIAVVVLQQFLDVSCLFFGHG